MRRLPGLLAILAFSIQPWPATAATPDASTIDAARKLLIAMDFKDRAQSLATVRADALMNQMRRAFPDRRLPPELETKVRTKIAAFLVAAGGIYTPEIMDQLASAYAAHLTRDDMLRLTAIMQDPAMQKFRDVTPAINAEANPIIGQAIAPEQQKLGAEIAQITDEWVTKHPEDRAKLLAHGEN